MISAETGEARLASTRDAVSRHVIGPHFGDQEYAVALTGNHAADQFLGAAIAVNLRRVNQRHSERKTRAQRFFLNGFRMSSLRETRRALTERRDDGAVVELYRAPCTVRSRASSGRSTSVAIIAPTEGSDEPSAAQSPLNSRRFSNRLFISSLFHCTILFHLPIALGRETFRPAI